MKLKTAFIVTGTATVLASVLRCVQMLFFFNDETGFVTDSGVFTYLYCGISLLATLFSVICCSRDKETCGVLQRGRSRGMGLSALLCMVFLWFCAAILLMNAYHYKNFGVTFYMEPSHVRDHMPFGVLSALFGLAALIIAVCWLRGGKLPGSIGTVWALGSVWGLYYMVITFMTYSAAATIQENLFTVGGGAMMLMFLLSEGKMLSGVGGRKASQSVFIFGLPAILFWVTYVLSNTVLLVCGRGYAAEMPYIIQLVMLSLTVHAVTVLYKLRSPELFVSMQQNTVRSKRK